MNISIWHILECLKDLAPEHRIDSGPLRISQLHLVSPGDPSPRSDRLAYLDIHPGFLEMARDPRASFRVTVSNGSDSVTVGDVRDPGALTNRLIALFTDMNDWENRLRHAAGRGDAQEIIDIATEQLRNPILLFDMEGNVLGMSASFLGDQRNPVWNQCRDSRKVPLDYSAIGASPADGQIVFWTREPQLLRLPDGSRAVGNYIFSDGRPIAGFSLREADRVVQPGDMLLVQVVQEILAGVLQRRDDVSPHRSLVSSLRDMLAGLSFQDDLLDMLRLPFPPPWQLLIVDSAGQKGAYTLYKQFLVPRLTNLFKACLPLEFEERVVALCSEADTDALTRLLCGNSSAGSFTVCVSLPFSDLHVLRARYAQTSFAFELAQGQAGTFLAERCMPRYLMSLNAVRSEQFEHPLLRQLRDYDARKKSELYETLYQYLLHDRSLQHGAQAMHVHKNTFTYRLDRIREMGGVDLDSPMDRLYLMMSYIADRPKHPLAPEEP